MPKNTTDFKLVKQKKWKPLYDELITALMLMSHTAAADKLGIDRTTISRLMKWPRFKREYRRRRAIMVEHADARLQGMVDTLQGIALMACNYIKPHVVEFEDHKGKLRKVTAKANPHLASSVAMQLLQNARDRATYDTLVSRADDIEALVKKKLKKAE